MDYASSGSQYYSEGIIHPILNFIIKGLSVFHGIKVRQNQVNFMVYRQGSQKIGLFGRQSKNNII